MSTYVIGFITTVQYKMLMISMLITGYKHWLQGFNFSKFLNWTKLKLCPFLNCQNKMATNVGSLLPAALRC